MSSAVAMNRRVAKERNDGSYEDFNSQNYNTNSERLSHNPTIGGTPVQQCWTILNFHETRLNRIEAQTHKLTHLHKMSNNVASSDQIELLMKRVDALEKENARLRQHLTQDQGKKNTMSLDVSEQ
jgi:hypothetical protein